MEEVRGKSVRYTQIILQEIYENCVNDRLDAVAEIVRSLFK